LHITILLIWHGTVYDAFIVFQEWFGREWEAVSEFKWEWELTSGNGREWEY